MGDTLKSLSALFLSFVILMVANALFSSLIIVNAQHEQISTSIIGIIGSAYFGGLLISTWLTRILISSVGHIRTFAALSAILAISSLIFVLFVDAYFWIVIRFVTGICMGAMFIITESWINDRVDNHSRGSVFSLYMILTYGGSGIGQFLLGFSEPGGHIMFTIISILFSVAVIPILLINSPTPKVSLATKLDLKLLFKVSPVGLMGAFIAGLVNSSFYTMSPIYTQSIGLTLKQTSQFLMIAIICGFILQWPTGKISDKIDRRIILAICSAFVAITSYVLYGYSAATVAQTLILAGIYGGFSFLIYSLSASHINDFSAPEKRVSTASGLLLIYSIGAVSGPILASTLISSIGAQYLFLYTAILNTFLAIYCLYRITQRKRVSTVSEFVPHPDFATTGSKIYIAQVKQQYAESDEINPDNDRQDEIEDNAKSHTKE